MGNSDTGQLANQAVLQISRKYTHTHAHTHKHIQRKTKLKRQNYHSKLPFQYFTLRCISSGNHLWLVGGRSTGLLWRKCIYMSHCVHEGMEVLYMCRHKASGGDEREAKWQGSLALMGSPSTAAACLLGSFSLTLCTHCQPLCTHVQIL